MPGLRQEDTVWYTVHDSLCGHHGRVGAGIHVGIDRTAVRRGCERGGLWAHDANH